MLKERVKWSFSSFIRWFIWQTFFYLICIRCIISYFMSFFVAKFPPNKICKCFRCQSAMIHDTRESINLSEIALRSNFASIFLRLKILLVCGITELIITQSHRNGFSAEGRPCVLVLRLASPFCHLIANLYLRGMYYDLKERASLQLLAVVKYRKTTKADNFIYANLLWNKELIELPFLQRSSVRQRKCLRKEICHIWIFIKYNTFCFRYT